MTMKKQALEGEGGAEAIGCCTAVRVPPGSPKYHGSTSTAQIRVDRPKAAPVSGILSKNAQLNKSRPSSMVT